MKKIGLTLFIVLFLVMALAPAVGMFVFGPAEAAANEILALPPSAAAEDGSFNRDVLNDASDYLRDRFWLRKELITVNAALEASLFRESASEKVILGKEGWLFFADTLDDYQGENGLTDRQIRAAARCLALIREYAEANGARVLFVPVPNKNTVYPEYMPDSASPGTGPKNYDRLLEACEAEDVPALDLRPVFAARRDEIRLYQTLDSHWNNLGAALAHDAILEALGREAGAFDPAAFTVRRDHKPDLYAMLYPAGAALDEQYYPKAEPGFQYLRPIRSPEDIRIQTTSETGTGSLLMFRDSFGNTLHSFMAEDWAEALFSRLMPYDLRLIQIARPDTVILEITERHLAWLAQRPPILPAPARDADLSAASAAEGIELTVTEEDGGLVCLAGELPLEPDDDSPIWLEADGAVFEASPAGETGRAFAAYLSARPETLRVCFRAGGVLLASPAALPTP